MDARVLDVFAGTGAIALEALSRGAAAATCVEQDRRAAQLIEENRALCGEENRCAIIRDAVERALARPIPGGPFDIIVLDPPYDYAGARRRRARCGGPAQPRRGAGARARVARDAAGRRTA